MAMDSLAAPSKPAIRRLHQIKVHLETDTAQPQSCPIPLPAKTKTPSASQQATSLTSGPSTILLFGWTGASPSQLRRYVSEYHRIYPSARVLVLDCAFADFYPWPLRSREQLERGFEEVVRAVDAGRAREKGNGTGDILIHIFSNGGSIRFAYIAHRYFQETGAALPIRAMILDSAIAPASPANKAYTVSSTLPYAKPLQWIIFLPLLMGMSFFHFLFHISPFQQEPVGWAWEVVNDPRFVSREGERVYIYSPSDTIVNWKGVEGHAAEARRTGYSVSLERFEGSGHVGHVKKDVERYWRLVRGVWEDGSSGSGGS